VHDLTSCNLCATVVAPTQPPRWRKDGFEIVECRSCGLLFRRDLPDRDALGEIYAPEYFARTDDGDAQGYLDYLGDADMHRMAARKRLRRLERFGAPGRLLDVGAAAGFFMDEARRRGWRVEGIDVAGSMTRYGREELGLELSTGVFEDSDPPRESYDCVTMWDYIEHAVDPAASFAAARRALKPRGILALSTGDAGSILARLSGSRWHLMTPRHHNFYLDPATIRRYLDLHSFDLVALTHPYVPYSLRYCVHKLGTMAPESAILRRASRWTSERRIGQLAIPANLWDVMSVVARRRD
jgi:SAM-dependent methyltransferase